MAKALRVFGTPDFAAVHMQRFESQWLTWSMPITDYHMFWAAMSTPSNSTMFAVKLLARLVDLVGSPDAASKKLTKVCKLASATQEESTEVLNTFTLAVCHTLHFLMTNYPVDKSDGNFQKALGALSRPEYVRVAARPVEERGAGVWRPRLCAAPCSLDVATASGEVATCLF